MSITLPQHGLALSGQRAANIGKKYHIQYFTVSYIVAVVVSTVAVKTKRLRGHCHSLGRPVSDCPSHDEFRLTSTSSSIVYLTTRWYLDYKQRTSRATLLSTDRKEASF